MITDITKRRHGWHGVQIGSLRLAADPHWLGKKQMWGDGQSGVRGRDGDHHGHNSGLLVRWKVDTMESALMHLWDRLKTSCLCSCR